MDYSHCTLCPRACGADRTAGKSGRCGMSDKMMAARAAPHYWEEPVISGSFGSGAVFFSGCSLGCVFCQNRQISHEGWGKEITSARLRQIFETMIDQGVQNINLVTPTHFLPSILPALEPKLPVPLVYNCGGYESVETLRRLEGLVDIYLPDMKYSDGILAGRLSGAEDYPAVAAAALLEMHRQVGSPVIRDEIMERGMIIRHLILPGQIDNSLGVLDWIAEHFRPDEILVSLMSQYTPMESVGTFPELNRPITELEYDAVVSYMDLLGISRGYTQDLEASAEAFIPSWDLADDAGADTARPASRP